MKVSEQSEESVSSALWRKSRFLVAAVLGITGLLVNFEEAKIALVPVT
jgi:hypothetical protein